MKVGSVIAEMLLVCDVQQKFRTRLFLNLLYRLGQGLSLWAAGRERVSKSPSRRRKSIDLKAECHYILLHLTTTGTNPGIGTVESARLTIKHFPVQSEYKVLILSPLRSRNTPIPSPCVHTPQPHAGLPTTTFHPVRKIPTSPSTTDAPSHS